MSQNTKNNSQWFSSVIIEGTKTGRTIGFPTLNLNNPEILSGKKKGVHAALVRINDEIYKGALYYGPRHVFGETHQVLEIFLLDFDREVYGETVSFQLVSFIRPVKKIPDLPSLKKQLEQDISQVTTILTKYPVKRYTE